jgi:uncharacterized protein with FMN-binding domain
MEPEQNNTTSIIKKVSLGALTLALIASVGIYLSQEKNKKEEPSDENVVVEETIPTPTQPAQSQATTGTVTASDYKDGTYKATGAYTSPAGQESVSVSLTLSGDIITAATFSGTAENPGSKNWQAAFSKGFTQVVVGKDIDSLALSVVNGSSLTSKGFMEAVASIKKEAKI